jgi:hypothetical protein
MVSYDDSSTGEYVQKYHDIAKSIVESRGDGSRGDESRGDGSRGDESRGDGERFKSFRINKIKRDIKGNHFPYNLYLNHLMNQIPKDHQNAWIMFLDDDDVLTQDTAIETIVNHIRMGFLGKMGIGRKNDIKSKILLWQVKFPPDRLVPKRIGGSRVPRVGDVSMIGFAFHVSWKDQIRFSDRKGGDHQFIKTLWNLGLEPIWIDQILSKVNYENVRRIGSGLRNDLKFNNVQNIEYKKSLDIKLSMAEKGTSFPKPVISIKKKTDDSVTNNVVPKPIIKLSAKKTKATPNTVVAAPQPESNSLVLDGGDDSDNSDSVSFDVLNDVKMDDDLNELLNQDQINHQLNSVIDHGSQSSDDQDGSDDHQDNHKNNKHVQVTKKLAFKPRGEEKPKINLKNLIAEKKNKENAEQQKKLELELELEQQKLELEQQKKLEEKKSEQTKLDLEKSDEGFDEDDGDSRNENEDSGLENEEDLVDDAEENDDDDDGAEGSVENDNGEEGSVEEGSVEDEEGPLMDNQELEEELEDDEELDEDEDMVIHPTIEKLCDMLSVEGKVNVLTIRDLQVEIRACIQEAVRDAFNKMSGGSSAVAKVSAGAGTGATLPKLSGSASPSVASTNKSAVVVKAGVKPVVKAALSTGAGTVMPKSKMNIRERRALRMKQLKEEKLSKRANRIAKSRNTASMNAGTGTGTGSRVAIAGRGGMTSGVSRSINDDDISMSQLSQVSQSSVLGGGGKGKVGVAMGVSQSKSLKSQLSELMSNDASDFDSQIGIESEADEDAKLSNLLSNYAQDAASGDDGDDGTLGTTGGSGGVGGKKMSFDQIDSFLDRVYIMNFEGHGVELQTKLHECGFTNVQVIEPNKRKDFLLNVFDLMKANAKKGYKKIAIFKDYVHLNKNFAGEFLHQLGLIQSKSDWKMIALGASQNLLGETGGFDWKFYLQSYPDLVKNNINNEATATKHWKVYGLREKRFGLRTLANPESFTGVCGLIVNDKMYADLSKLQKARDPREFILKNYKSNVYACSPLLCLAGMNRMVKMRNRHNLDFYN